MAQSGHRERGSTPVRKPSQKPAGKSAPNKRKPAKSKQQPGRKTGRPPGRPPGKSANSQGRPSRQSKQPARHTTKRPLHNLGGDQVEGRHAVRELLLADKRDVREVFLVAGQDSADILHDIIDLADEAKIPIRQVSRGRFDTLTRTEAAQGVIALAAPIRPVPLEDLCQPAPNSANSPPFLVLVDNITDPHNLGALIRTAEAAGVTGLVFSRHNTSKITATVAKAAAGAVEHVPMAQVNSLAVAMRELKQHGIWVVGLDETAETSVWDMNLAREPVALVLGSEGKGLSRLVLEECDLLVSIPLTGVIASLNVSVAGAVAAFIVQHQRSQAG